MKKLILLVVLLISVINAKSSDYIWTNIGENLPQTVSTATISGIEIIGDSMWISSGYGNYQNQTPGEIYFSTDRGKTFTVQTTLYGTHTIKMLNAKVGYCGGVEGQIYKTSDAGQTWERKVYGFGTTLMSIDFPPNSDTGYVSGFNAHVKMLTPNGLTSINMGVYVNNIYSVSCIDSRHCFVAGGEIIGPVVNGEFLINQSYPGTDGVYAISMVDTLYGWCVGSPTAAGAWDSSGCMIIRTLNGRDWEEQINPIKGKSGTLLTVKAVNKNEAWTAGTSGQIIHTTDAGQTWKAEAQGLTKEMLTDIEVTPDGEVYIVGNNRTIMRYAKSSSVTDHTTESKIYPNPAKDYLNLVDINGQVQILDVLGRIVYESDIYNTNQINIQFLESGIYYLKSKDRVFSFIKSE